MKSGLDFQQHRLARFTCASVMLIKAALQQSPEGWDFRHVTKYETFFVTRVHALPPCHASSLTYHRLSHIISPPATIVDFRFFALRLRYGAQRAPAPRANVRTCERHLRQPEKSIPL